MTHLDELLSCYLDGELSAVERERVASHLPGCTRCRLELDDLAAIRSAVRGLPLVEMAFDVASDAPPPMPIRTHPLRWVAAAAAVGFVGFVTVSGWNSAAAVSVTPAELSARFGANSSVDLLTPLKVEVHTVGAGRP